MVEARSVLRTALNDPIDDVHGIRTSVLLNKITKLSEAIKLCEEFHGRKRNGHDSLTPRSY